VLVGFGYWAAHYAVDIGSPRDTCSPVPVATSWTGITVSGLPTTAPFTTAFGYGRGTRTIESTLTLTAAKGTKLARRYVATVEPLTTANGLNDIPAVTAPFAAGSKGARGVYAVATQIAGTGAYSLQICVVAPGAAAGAYSGQLTFPGGRSPQARTGR
jgi:hypothetical protein